MRYLLNINSGKIHDCSKRDGRCKINQIREENKKYFETLEEAMEYPDKESRIGRKCTFCLLTR